MSGSNYKRIAKNTVLLYLRMLIIMGVTLYTSRVILHTLGFEDYGIFNVVGGLTVSFAFFSSALSNATQRYLNVELGRNDLEGVNRVFNISILLYLIISIAVIILGEIVGLWLLNNKLVIPSERIDAANVVFHTTIIGLAITLVSSVYESVLIARENMKIYAYLSVVEVIIKLLIVYSLNWITYDKLTLYAILFLLSQIFIKSVSVLYCHRKYSECKFVYQWDKDLVRGMFHFIGWNGVGTAVWMLNEQGINILMNMFFGPVVNAARGISAQVSAAVNNFSNSFYTAVRPQIVMSYAQEDDNGFIKLINFSSKYSFYLIWLLCLPIIVRRDSILHLWLNDVPQYTSELVIWVLLFNCVNVLVNPFWTGVQAVGKLKKYILVGNAIFISAFPISYILLKLGYSPVAPFVVLTVVRTAYLFATIKIFSELVKYSIKDYLKTVIYPIVKVFLASGLLSLLINEYIPMNFIGLILMTGLSIIVTLLCVYLLGLSNDEKNILVNKLRGLIKRN